MPFDGEQTVYIDEGRGAVILLLHGSGPGASADANWRLTVMAIALHPYLSGVPHRVAALDDALGYICSHEKVWKATGSEIATAFEEAAPRG